MYSKIIFFILLNLLVLDIFSQNNYSNYHIKEKYDAVFNSVVPENYLGNKCNFDLPENLSDRAGDRVSYVLLSLIRMYQTTGDKAYLIHFIKNYQQIIIYEKYIFIYK